MVDREARDRLIAAVEAYLDGRTTAFDFDEQIHDVSFETDDTTVQQVVWELWLRYDDCTNHKVRLTRGEWDGIQRLLLVLHSEAELRECSRRVWTWRQTIAAAGLVAFLLVLCRVGWSPALCVAMIPLGLVSLGLSRWDEAHARAQAREQARGQAQARAKVRARAAGEEDCEWLAPFRSFAELRILRRACPAFRKRRFPAHAVARRTRSRIVEWSRAFYVLAARLYCAPVVLLFQAIPDLEGEVWVELPPAGDTGLPTAGRIRSPAAISN